MIQIAGAENGIKSNDSDGNVDDTILHAAATTPEALKASPRRGNLVPLPKLFLRPPSFRFIAETTDAEFQHFSVVFYRVKGKLGIQVQAMQGCIVVRALSGPTASPSSKHTPKELATGQSDVAPTKGLAEQSGVLVGDILAGFDGGLFTPGVQIEDIVRQLATPRDYLTLHFKRPLVADFWTSENRLHPLATVLLRQKAVDLVQARRFSEGIAAVNERTRQWRSGYMTQRLASGKVSCDEGQLDSDGIASTPDICISTRSLRPALSVRILETGLEGDRTVYRISVYDVESDSRWTVSRRFRAFYELREKLAAEQPSIAALPFPSRKLTWSESWSIINNRQQTLEHFLREILTLPFSQALHPSTSRVQILLQEFLGVPAFAQAIDAKLSAMHLHHVCRQSMQTHIHGILNISHFQKVIAQFFGRCGRQPNDPKWVGSSAALVKLVSQFLDSLQFILADTMHTELQAVVKEHALDVNDSAVGNIINAAIRRQVEMEIYTPLEAVLFAAVRSEINPMHEFRIAQLPAMQSNPQSAFDIPPEHISLSSWESAIDLMAEVKHKYIPYDKLACLAEACKEIPRLYIREHPSSLAPLAADDFLPIFIYVLVHAELNGLLEHKHILPEMCEPSQRLSEQGYYVATFAAAIEHLLEADS